MSSDPSTATEHPPSALPVGTRLGEFELTRVLGVGGFGIVYLAFDHALHREVAVKEYMPVSLAGRTETLHVSLRSQSDAETFALGLKSFVNEARLLARFDHPSLVKVHRFWEANGTAYMAMPVYRGHTLKQVRAGMSAAPDEAWLRAMLLPLLGAIDKLHGEGVYHRDIAPDNIQLEADGRPVLLDFGAARHIIADKSQALTAILKPAYAPIEQYGEAGSVKQGPWTDLYALGATLHFMLLGRPPPPATARAVHDDLQPLADAALPGCSAGFLNTIDWMLAPRPNDRPQNVAALLDVLEGRAAPPLRPAPPAAAPAEWQRTQVLAPMPSSRHVDDGTVVRPRSSAVAALPAAPPAPTSPPAPAAAPVPPATTATGASKRLPLIVGAAAVALLALGAGWWWSLPAVVEAPVLATVPPAATVPAPAEPSAAAPASAAGAVEPVPLPAVAAPVIAATPAAPAARAASPPEPRPATAVSRPAVARPAPLPAAPPPAARPAEAVTAAPTPAPEAASAGTAVLAGATPAKALSPKEGCGSRRLLALWNCVERQCRKAELRQHPDCIDLRAEQERRANPTQ